MNEDLFKCLSDLNRRRILYCIGGQEMCVNSISECLELEQSLVSHHLKELYTCGLVTRERRGKKNYYKVSQKQVMDLLENAKELGDSLKVCKSD